MQTFFEGRSKYLQGAESAKPAVAFILNLLISHHCAPAFKLLYCTRSVRMGTGAGRISKSSRRHKRGRRRLEDHRHFDQIVEDIQNNRHLEDKPIDLDLPGLGQHHCAACSRHFVSEGALRKHEATKPHKRQVKLLKKESAYSHREAMMAAGKIVDDGPAICTS